MRFIVTLVLLASVVACGSDLTFAPELGIDLSEFQKTSSGLYVQDLAAGTGPQAAANDTAWVNYTVWFVNGVLLDESGDNPLRFVVGTGQVIEGFDEGVTGMRLGGHRKLVVPPELGYGAADIQVGDTWIPGGSTLVYDVELVDLRKVSTSGAG